MIQLSQDRIILIYGLYYLLLLYKFCVTFTPQNMSYFHWICPIAFVHCYVWGSEKAMAPHSSTLARKIPWMEELGRLQSMGSRRVGHDWVTSLSLFTFMYWRRKWQLQCWKGNSSVLAWRIPGTGEPGGLPSMGSHRVRHDWSDLAAAAAVCIC